MFPKLFVCVLLSIPMLAQVSQKSAATPLNDLASITPSVRSSLLSPSVASPAAIGSTASAQTGLKDFNDHEHQGVTLYKWSIAALLGSNVADIATSWSGMEANPVVAGGRSQFGATSVAIKSGFVGASLLIQHVVLRHRPDLHRQMAWMNFATSGVLGGVAAHNASLR